MAPASQPYSSMHDAQVFIPGTSFIYRVQHRIMEGDCQCDHGPRFVTVSDFYIDRYPVTNLQFQRFLEESGYWPEDDTNFLKHWVQKQPPIGKEHHPVIWVKSEGRTRLCFSLREKACERDRMAASSRRRA
ncbi:SUMF1/EgtB/PvdO family nonheme iron enzyme [Paenibacillus roseipurpureus]|uniref:SUMF1/EgtB/PvdO family nonheme iron enzyme n=1 Tax=Paenibacillus roseopurpureus TaxID=2918901 RepID=A0AA96LQF1_9BACL|nr:SUMF1/EgtB/PvdO family nonheme iron enzyme [Paenibacillus sp. MBLB1832]WNR45417.1 SUMF1/EgtB/PvdO family nonheme iron enzyme [Paenibacillus sp. MBLB1832]